MTEVEARHGARTTPAAGSSGELRRGIGRTGFIVLGKRRCSLVMSALCPMWKTA